MFNIQDELKILRKKIDKETKKGLVKAFLIIGKSEKEIKEAIKKVNKDLSHNLKSEKASEKVFISCSNSFLKNSKS